MTKPLWYEPVQESLDDKERELMDPDNWDWEQPVEMVVREDFGFIFPIPLTSLQVARLEPIARAEEMTIHEFIKRAALARIAQGVSRRPAPKPLSCTPDESASL